MQAPVPPLPDPDPSIGEIIQFERHSRLPLPLYIETVAAGFPSPADDYIDCVLDLNDLLIEHEAATFFLRVRGDSMSGAHIQDGDLLVVDRALEPRDKSIVVALISGEFTVKRIRICRKRVFLEPANPAYPLVEVREEMDVVLWGVVTHVIHALT